MNQGPFLVEFQIRTSTQNEYAQLVEALDRSLPGVKYGEGRHVELIADLAAFGNALHQGDLARDALSRGTRETIARLRDSQLTRTERQTLLASLKPETAEDDVAVALDDHVRSVRTAADALNESMRHALIEELQP